VALAWLAVDNKKGKMTHQQPVAEIISCHRHGEVLQTILSLNHIPASPIAPASLYERHPYGTKVLELHTVARRTGNRITFHTYDDRVKPLNTGRAYVFMSWWSLDQLELVRDSSQQWNKEKFVLQDAVEVPHTDAIKALRPRREGEDVIDEVLIARGWDHEHCFHCWRKILPGEDDNGIGNSDGEKWMCEDCYKTYTASGLGRKLGE
jgi:hypothetical protein